MPQISSDPRLLADEAEEEEGGGVVEEEEEAAVANERRVMGRAEARRELVTRGMDDAAGALATRRDATARDASERNMTEDGVRAAETINDKR